MPPLTASPATEPRVIPSSWTGFDAVTDPEAVEALNTYKKKDPSKGARSDTRSVGLFGRLSGEMLYDG